VDIRAPQSGFVHQLAVHTVGGVVGNGETIMLIVPAADKLVVEAKVAPQDIDQVTRGATTTVRIMAGNQRTMIDLFGEINYIAADLTREKDQPNMVYYQVRASIPEEEVRRLENLKLVPGMPAELFIQTHERTPLEYLLKPFQEQLARTFRER
jgi:HlyD family secretion protein